MRQINILLVEDNDGDILLTQEAFLAENFQNKLIVLKDGESAIKFLSKSREYKNRSLPDLILLDINLPKLDGHEVLRFIKTTENLKNIPVIILTTSSSNSDIDKAYSSGANAYVIKSDNFANFVQSIKCLNIFWTTIAVIPMQRFE